MKIFAKLGAIVLAASLCASAAELATLKNGFTMRHEHHAQQGETTRLYLDQNGSSFVDVATDQIVSFEHDDSPVPVAAPAPAVQAKTIAQHITDASGAQGIDEDFIASVIHSESGFNPRAVSLKGARGLMQLMPGTALKLGVKDSFDPGENISGGTQYLRELLELYNGDAIKALAAYNAGPHRVNQYHGVPPYHETQAYVARIIREYNQKKLAQQKASAAAKAAATAPEIATTAALPTLPSKKRAAVRPSTRASETRPAVPAGGQ